MKSINTHTNCTDHCGSYPFIRATTFRIAILVYLLISINFCVSSQPTFIGGIINQYTAVTAVNPCEASAVVSSTAGFQAGDLVLLIQMKGATVNSTNTAQHGNIDDYGNSGNYEIQKIKTINGNVITFEYTFLRTYDATGSVQLVSVPVYQTAIVDSSLRAKSWDGASGGILVLQADSVIFNDTVDLRGKGFRGGQKENDAACFNNGINGAFDYRCATTICGAPKGEGIGSNLTQLYGRGNNAQGGGGGNDHNTGGGGGSNGGAGGRGGTRSNVSQFSCPGPSPGIGGIPIAYSNASNKIFMGGGGGAGEQNNNQGTSGGNGGGIGIFIANTIIGNNQKINANGESVSVKARSDGAGGGGGGGTVLLYTNNVVGNLRITAAGGDGGKLDNGNDPDFCFGPGAGGGGGVLWTRTSTTPATVSFIDTGGTNGFQLYALSSSCPLGTTNGAQPGQPGITLHNLQIPTATEIITPLNASICCDTTVCRGSQVIISATATGMLPITYSWSTGSGSPSITFQANLTTTVSVTVTDKLGCEKVLNVDITVQNDPPSISVCCDTSICRGNSITVTASPNVSSYSYVWSTGLSGIQISDAPVFNRTYRVTVTDQNGCTATDEAYVQVLSNSTNIIALPDSAILLGQDVQLIALSDSTFTFIWSPNSAINNTSIFNPVVTPESTTEYCVTVTDTAGCIASACKLIELIIPEIKVPDAFSPNNDGVNDLFIVFPLKYAQINNIKIYNRWGEVVFNQNGNYVWDGTYKGTEQPAGSYVVNVTYSSPLNPAKSKTVVKDILLIR